MRHPACLWFEWAARRGQARASETWKTHAADCRDCREGLALREEISRAAPTLRKTWESPALWPRIQNALAAEACRPSAAREESSDTPLGRPRFVWLPLAVAAALFLIATAGLQVFRGSFGERELLTARTLPKEPLLTEATLKEVEKSERSYVHAIEQLSKLAEPGLKDSGSALLVGYREKLLLLDSAIGDLRAQLDQNRFNTHLRRELLTIYQEKQRTLERVVKEVKS
ncbi:MAG TPA: anti-sigma factor [Thermoanaerobaculia bacterium]|nr:anti-sigma factor [Thermoanaerobaculia bacterium]